MEGLPDNIWPNNWPKGEGDAGSEPKRRNPLPARLAMGLRSILEAQQGDLPTCWSMAWEGRPLGWALSTTSLQLDGSTKVRSRVHFDELPLEDVVDVITGSRVLVFAWMI